MAQHDIYTELRIFVVFEVIISFFSNKKMRATKAQQRVSPVALIIYVYLADVLQIHRIRFHQIRFHPLLRPNWRMIRHLDVFWGL